MPNSTTRLGLQEPITSDGPSELRGAITNNATALDGTVLVSQGILASIPSPPSPNVVGQTYYATDTGLWYFYTGSGWKALALEVGSVGINSGTLAARPATPSPNVVGQTYYATDTGLWYFWTGSAWQTVGLEQGWTAIPLGTNWSATAGYYVPSYQIVGNMVFLAGAATNGTGGPSQSFFASPLPAAIRPASTVNALITNVGQMGVLTIAPAGTMSNGVSNAAGDSISFDTTNYRLS